MTKSGSHNRRIRQSVNSSIRPPIRHTVNSHPMSVSAVLLSAGLDSAVLAAQEARHGRVPPVCVSRGLAGEAAELAALERLLLTPPFAALAPLERLTFTVTDLYPPSHWALRGTPPAFDTPDEDVYLTGRNVTLLAKSAI